MTTDRPVATPDRTLHMVGNTYLDPVGLWPWQEGRQEARATFWSAIHRMDEYPDFVFTCDQIVLLAWVEESDPELFERIRERVAEDRWVNAGGSIGITAVRSPVYSWHDPKLLDADGFYSFQDQGVQRFSYLLVPHAGEWREAGLARRAVQLGAPPRAMLESFHPGALPAEQSFVSDGGGQVAVSAVKGWQDGDANAPDVIVRAAETTGVPASAKLNLAFLDRVLDVDFRPSQIRTFRVPRDTSQPVVEVDLLEWELNDASAGKSVHALRGEPGDEAGE